MLSLLSVAIVCICRWTVIFKHQPLRTPQCNLDRFIITIMFFRHQGRNSNSNIIIIIIIIVLTLGIYTTEGTKKIILFIIVKTQRSTSQQSVTQESHYISNSYIVTQDSNNNQVSPK